MLASWVMLYSFKGQFQKFALLFAQKKMSANQASAAGAISSLLIAMSLYIGTHANTIFLLFVPFLLLIRLIANALDGLIARATKTASASGELMNELLDIGGDSICFGTLFYMRELDPKILALFLVLIWAVEFVGMMGRALPGRERRHESFGGGKSERAVWLGLAALIYYFSPAMIRFGNHFFLFLSLLCFITLVIRYRKILQVTQGKTYESFTAFGR